MGRMAIKPQIVACINAMLIASHLETGEPTFGVEEVLELFESLMPEPVQRVEPVWSNQTKEWQWLPVQHRP